MCPSPTTIIIQSIQKSKRAQLLFSLDLKMTWPLKGESRSCHRKLLVLWTKIKQKITLAIAANNERKPCPITKTCGWLKIWTDYFRDPGQQMFLYRRRLWQRNHITFLPAGNLRGSNSKCYQSNCFLVERRKIQVKNHDENIVRTTKMSTKNPRWWWWARNTENSVYRDIW